MLEASVDRGLPPRLDTRSARAGSGIGPKTTRGRTGYSPQVSIPHLDAVAPWPRQGGTIWSTELWMVGLLMLFHRRHDFGGLLPIAPQNSP